MISLPVEDVITIERTVDIPDDCPKCGTSLHEPDALLNWEYQDQKRRCSYIESGIDWGTNDINQGEGYITIGWRCAHCDHDLGSHQEVKIGVDDTRARTAMLKAMLMVEDYECKKAAADIEHHQKATTRLLNESKEG